MPYRPIETAGGGRQNLNPTTARSGDLGITSLWKASLDSARHIGDGLMDIVRTVPGGHETAAGGHYMISAAIDIMESTFGDRQTHEKAIGRKNAFYLGLVLGRASAFLQERQGPAG